MASPMSSEISARILGLLKCVTAWTIARARLTGSPDYKKIYIKKKMVLALSNSIDTMTRLTLREQRTWKIPEPTKTRRKPEADRIEEWRQFVGSRVKN